MIWKTLSALAVGGLVDAGALAPELGDAVLEQIDALAELPLAEAVEGPAGRPTPPALPPRAPAAPPTPSVARTQGGVTVTFRGNVLHAECSGWTNFATVYYNGCVAATGCPILEESYWFTANEGGQWAHYDVTVRGPGLSMRCKPYFTVRRNGFVLFNDR